MLFKIIFILICAKEKKRKGERKSQWNYGIDNKETYFLQGRLRITPTP